MPGDYGWINTYFWIPIVAPLIGAALAVPAYDIGIRKILIARLEAGEEAEAGRVPGEGPPPGTVES
jgi:glycerol uptake facilitator protein